MNKDWSACKKVICIRPDNMGDLLMSSPAIRAIKQSFHCHLTVLTSTAGALIARFIPEIDEVIAFDLPWVKQDNMPDTEAPLALVELLKEKAFDAAVIFTVYSQNPLPSAMLAYLAGIPRRLAYCRENPYDLITHWVPDKEPYEVVYHQVRRDLELVKTIGAHTNNERLSLQWEKTRWTTVERKLSELGVDTHAPWLIMHAGVSEKKREFDSHALVEAGKNIIRELNYQVLLTGSRSEQQLINSLKAGIGEGAFSLAGLLDIEALISLIDKAPLIISVNSGPIHIAAATGTPVLVLYALTNPQHLPWKVTGKALYYDVPLHLRSKNEVIRFVHDHLFERIEETVSAKDILLETKNILLNKAEESFPELVPLRNYEESSATVSLNTKL
jgi:ADP-heptose:LPS heptosyltransferase